jgi:hypothetical protein
MIKFRLAPHTPHEGDAVEIWIDGAYVGAVYPQGELGIQVVSLDRTGMQVSCEPGTPTNIGICFPPRKPCS